MKKRKREEEKEKDKGKCSCPGCGTARKRIGKDWQKSPYCEFFVCKQHMKMMKEHLIQAHELLNGKEDEE